MKLPESIQQLLHKKPETREVFLSLLVEATGVVAQAWEMGGEGRVESIETVVRDIPQDSWEERTKAVDSAITVLEDKAGTLNIHKVVLGMPAAYLTETGDISPTIRPHIKKLTKDLALKAMGFVSLPAALIHQLKKEEGVPLSAILIGVGGGKVTVSLYKVGVLAGQKIFAYEVTAVSSIEEALQSFTEAEVLPSRILLYGLVPSQLEQLRGELLRHPWPTRANFLHFPKIEALPVLGLISAVSLAGASELALTLGEEITSEEPEKAESAAPETAPAVPVPPKELAEETESEEEISTRAGESLAEAQEANVEMVAPEDLGFARNVDVLEPVPPKRDARLRPPVAEAAEEKPSKVTGISLPKLHLDFSRFSLPKLPRFKLSLPALGLHGLAPVVAAVALVTGLLGLLYWLLPRATVTVLEVSQPLENTAVVLVDPGASDIDSAGKVIPGKKQEKSVSGQKALPVTGKKKVGDPAKGTVTIYNKITSSRLFRKGTALTAGSLAFTLDSDVTVASASETIGSITFGKANAAVTATSIGAEGNLPAGTELSFKDYPTSSVVARNDNAFAGGTSREVTVVSRADYDSLVKVLTGELVDKAKQDLAGSVGGGEKLIDATVKTALTEKTFNQELDQEASTLEGKLTLTVSGVSYNEDQLKTLLKTLLSGSIPAGYTPVDTRTVVSVTNPVIKKDGKISLTAKFQGVALPNLDIAAIKKEIAGKKITAVQEYLRQTSGVGGVEFHFRYSLGKSRLPFNQNNISVSVAIQE